MSKAAAIPDVRLKLDLAIAAAEGQYDGLEAASRDAKSSAAAPHISARMEHTLGRLHGLKEAREMLDLLEMTP